MVRVLGGRMMPPSRMKKQESLSSCFQRGHQTPSVSFFRMPFGIGRATRVMEWRNLTGTPGVQGRWCHRDSRHSGVSSILTWKPRSGDGVFCSLSLTSFLSLILRAPHHSWTTPWRLSRSLSAAGGHSFCCLQQRTLAEYYLGYCDHHNEFPHFENCLLYL